jgi:peroxidase
MAVTGHPSRPFDARGVRSQTVQLVAGALLAAALGLPVPEAEARGRHGGDRGDAIRDSDRVSPVLRIERSRKRRHGGDHRGPAEFRSIDGRGNNRARPQMGAAGTPLLRLLPADYADGVSALAGPDRPGPREISERVAHQPAPIANPLEASDYLWQWGQFVDHDIDLTDGADPPEPRPIPVPAGDPWFDPGSQGGATIPFNRSIYDPASGTDAGNPRQQTNEISAWIDGSNVYGSDPDRADALRTHDGTGRLRTSEGGLLPFNTEGLPNAGGSGPELFLAGDVRANEQVGLTALHTLFVREHNRLARRLARKHPDWDGERLYQKARQLVGAEMQAITVREFLPALLGPDPLPAYSGYDPEVDAGISNAFSTAVYRFGHSALGPTLLRLDRRGREIRAGHLPLREAFFAPQRITEEGGIEPLLRGLAGQRCQRVDVQIVDDVRNFLFGPPGGGGFDLAALNIQRGRDHGLPSYNDAREALGLPRAERFSDVSSDPDTQARLADAYVDPDQIDLWVGGLAEDPLPGGHVGELVHHVLVDQFQALRDGDRFWYERTLGREERRQVEATRLSDVIRANTTIGDELPDDVFRAARRRRR